MKRKITRNKEKRLRSYKVHVRWYSKAENRIKQANWVKIRYERRRKWFRNLKETLKCQNCGFSHPSAIEFHHKNPKSKEVLVSQAIAAGWSEDRISKEIKKCEILCSNCHRVLHWKRQKKKF